MKKKAKANPVENENALKHMYNRELLKRMGKAISDVHPDFDEKRFLKLMPELEKLEMKPRVRLLRDELRKQLPANYETALNILLRSMDGQKLSGFDLWPYTEFIQTFGLEHHQLSLQALKKITQLFTAEWAVRPFLRADPKQTMKFLLQCARDPNVHIRRWASEGTRPRLPWGERLHDFVKDPSLVRPILEQLKFDSELYVRKSVSNHLNDIAKDHPDWVVAILSEWKQKAGKKHAEKIDWIIHRALRTLIKNGHSAALELIGISQDANINLVDLQIRRKKIKMGDRIEFQFQVQSRSKQPHALVVDYIIHFVKANRKRTPKVFKLKRVDIPAMGKLQIQKSHHMKTITTREYYAGAHLLEIQINGRVMGQQEWTLEL